MPVALPEHPGETCVIIGNGASLKDVPRSFLDKYPTFGANYLNRLPYQPTYYICIDSTILNYNAGEIYTIASLARHAFISTYPAQNPLLNRLRMLKNVIHVDKDTFVFQDELYMSGNTCAYVAMKIAFVMGFTRALLVGIDHDAQFKHFDAAYPTGAPNFEGMRYHFAIAANIWATHGREIINLSPPSALDRIFRRGELKDYCDSLCTCNAYQLENYGCKCGKG